MNPEMREKFSPEDYLFLKGRGVMDYFAPRDIENWLHNEGGIIGQEEACKTAAILIHRHYEQNCPSVTLFCGPTGSGKTAIWRALQKEYSAKNIVIVDASSLTAEGWKGGNKISTIFRSLDKDTRQRCILCLDEWDKCTEPQYGANGTNYSDILQNQMLALFDHQTLFFGSEERERDSFSVDTSSVSIVLLGAFERLLEAKSRDTKSLGFGANIKQKCTYGNTEISADDLLKYTCVREEIVGRIDRIVTMTPLTVQDYLRILTLHIEGLQKKMHTPIDIDSNSLAMIARMAIGKNLGARWAKHKVDAIIDELVYNDPYPERFVFRYEPPDADEQRQSLCME